jgi:hypothetical protein
MPQVGQQMADIMLLRGTGPQGESGTSDGLCACLYAPVLVCAAAECTTHACYRTDWLWCQSCVMHPT